MLTQCKELNKAKIQKKKTCCNHFSLKAFNTQRENLISFYWCLGKNQIQETEKPLFYLLSGEKSLLALWLKESKTITEKVNEVNPVPTSH